MLKVGHNGSNRHLNKYSKYPRIFIAHSHCDENKISLLRNQRDQSKLDKFTDYSVKKPYDYLWKNGVRYRIKSSDCVLIGIGNKTNQSKSVEWEYNTAKKYGKKIIPVRLTKNAKIPTYIKENKEKIINWNCKTINKEINKGKHR